MKSLIPALVALFFGALVLRAQPAVELYLAEEELPDLVQCLPAPPDTIGEAFTHDIMRYMWGKTQRLDPERLAVAKLDAVWDLDTLRTIYSVPFGMEISPEKTPEIYRAFVNGVSTIEQIRFRPKAHYFRMRPYARFKEESIFPQDDAWLATEGSYPSGHTIRAWSAALRLRREPRHRGLPLAERRGRQRHGRLHRLRPPADQLPLPGPDRPGPRRIPPPDRGGPLLGIRFR